MIYAVIDNVTGKQVNLIVGEPTDIPPEGFSFVEIPRAPLPAEIADFNASDGATAVPIEVNSGN